MTWEYLDNTRLDGRLLVVAGYLSNRIEGKNIVDLNCGTGRLINYLPRIYTNYYCNDINLVPSCIQEPIDFHPISDTEMVTFLADKMVDVVCVLGHGGGHELPNVHESISLSNSAMLIIEKHKPEIVILEANFTYVWKHHVLKSVLDWAIEACGYKIKQDIVVKPAETNDTLAERNIIILER